MNQQNLHTVNFQPDGRSTAVRHAATLLEAARKAGVAIPTRCGGKAGCLMCKIHIEENEAARISPPGDVERRKLGSALAQGTRLACQAAVRGDLTVHVPEDPLKAAVRRKLEAARRGEEDELW